MDSVADSLAGRAAIIPMLGLSGAEWQICEPLKNKFNWKEFL